MKTLALSVVISRLRKAATLVGALREKAETEPRMNRALASVELMVSTAIQEIANGIRAETDRFLVAARARGHNRAAIANIESLMRLDCSAPFRQRLHLLIVFLLAATGDRPIGPARRVEVCQTQVT